MNNFIFKSANRLIKNSSLDLDKGLNEMYRNLQLLLQEQRHQRSDLKTITGMIDRLLIDKHLQMQVDEYFTENSSELEDK